MTILPTQNIFQNYLYLLRLIAQASPLRIPLAVVTEVISNFFGIFYSVLFFSYFMERVSAGADFHEVLFLLTAVGMINILYEVLFSLYRNLYVARSNIKISLFIRSTVYRKILTMDMANFDSAKYYDEVTFTTENIFDRTLGILGTLASFSAHLFCAGVLVSFFSKVNGWVIVIALLSLVLGLVTEPIKNRISFRYAQQAVPFNRRLDYLNRVLISSDYAVELRVTNMKNVLQSILQAAFEGHRKLLKLFETKITILETVSVMFGYVLVSFLITLISIHKMVVLVAMSIAVFLPLLSAVAEFTWRASSVISLFNQLREHNLYIQKIYRFMEAKPIVVSHGNRRIGPMRTLRFKNVSFRYTDQGGQALRKIQFEVQAGQKIAIVGYNGAGKSTLVNLLLRLYDPTEGTIEYNGSDIRQFDLGEYRRRFSVLFQDIHLYAASYKENILMGADDNPSKDKLADLAERFHMKDKINDSAYGFETELTREFCANGELLSGGQTQNLALMRLYYHQKADIYVLDEPTSALDPLTEAQIFESVCENSVGKTVFFISHRFASSKAADKVLFMENGEITESGTHDELMKLNGAYAEMFRMQAQYYQTREGEQL